MNPLSREATSSARAPKSHLRPRAALYGARRLQARAWDLDAASAILLLPRQNPSR
jgi:hypothetical protein